MRPDKIRLIKIVYTILQKYDKQDLALARDIVEALAAEQFFSGHFL